MHRLLAVLIVLALGTNVWANDEAELDERGYNGVGEYSIALSGSPDFSHQTFYFGYRPRYGLGSLEIGRSDHKLLYRGSNYDVKAIDFGVTLDFAPVISESWANLDKTHRFGWRSYLGMGSSYPYEITPSQEIFSNNFLKLGIGVDFYFKVLTRDTLETTTHSLGLDFYLRNDNGMGSTWHWRPWTEHWVVQVNYRWWFEDLWDTLFYSE